MNVVLLYSSVLNGIVCGLLLYLFYFPEYNVLYFVTILGIFTSVWNHGTTLDIAKWSDRICMIVCFLVYIGFCKTLIEYSIISAMVVFYFLAKYFSLYDQQNVLSVDVYHVLPEDQKHVLPVDVYHVLPVDVCHVLVHLLFLALFGVIQLEKYHSYGFSPYESFTN
jgi:hypothetical protein